MPSNYKQLSVSRVADNSETDRHCAAAAVVVAVIVGGLEEAQRLPPGVWWRVKPEKVGEIMFYFHTAARYFSNRNRLMHNYAETIWREDFITDVPCSARCHTDGLQHAFSCLLGAFFSSQFRLGFLKKNWYKLYGVPLVCFFLEENWISVTVLTSEYIK